MSNLSNDFDAQSLSVFTAGLVKESVFPDYSFMRKFTNVSSYLNGRYVNFPFYTNQTGTITKNGSTFDANAVSQTQQTTIQFIIDCYRVGAFLITSFENQVLNFDKASIEIRQNVTYLENYIANQTIKALVLDTDASKVITTSGGNGTANGADGLTAKKKIQYSDFLNLKKMMDRDNLPGERNILVDAETMSEILGDSNLSKYLETGYASVVEGKYPKIAGINIIERSEVCALSTSGAVKIAELGDTMVSSDVRVSLAFIGDAVGIAMQDPKVYTSLDASFYGVKTSAEVYFGVKNLREDKKGVYYIKQG